MTYYNTHSKSNTWRILERKKRRDDHSRCRNWQRMANLLPKVKTTQKIETKSIIIIEDQAPVIMKLNQLAFAFFTLALPKYCLSHAQEGKHEERGALRRGGVVTEAVATRNIHDKPAESSISHYVNGEREMTEERQLQLSYSAFTSITDLRNAVYFYCADPAGWNTTPGFMTYG